MGIVSYDKQKLEELRSIASEQRRLLKQTLDLIQEMKVKCPTCRCKILPDEKCTCCDDIVIPDISI